MSEEVLDCVARALDQAASFDGNIHVQPIAVLWPDKDRQWESTVELLRTRRRVLTLGPYDPGSGSGPAFWIRCVVEGTVSIDGPQGLPIVYMPGVTRDDLRNVDATSQALAPLAPLQHKSQWFAQSSGKDWTARALLINRDRGLGLNVAADDGTIQALLAGLNQLVQQPFSYLEGRYLDAVFLNGLLNPDPVRRLLRWISDPSAVEQELKGAVWDAFVSQCKSDFNLNPSVAGVIEAARKLGQAEGAWQQVWQRFRESPTDYPGIPGRLREAKPAELFTPSNSLAWPQDNDAAEDQLRARLLDLVALTPSGARGEISRLEEEYRQWRGSVWAQLGHSPLALALEHLAELAERCHPLPTAVSVGELRQAHMTTGWKVDLAALRTLNEVTEERDLKAVAAALESTYRPWLEAGAKALQSAVGPEANSGTYLVEATPKLSVGQIVIFVDGLRLDVAQLLSEKLEGAGANVTLDVGLAALPTVTQTSKPALAPIEQSSLGPGQLLDACRISSGASAGAQVVRSLLSEVGVQVLSSQERGDPSGKGWTEAGEIDHKGHDAGVRLAREIDDEVTRIARRTRELLDAGWSVVTIVTDHGWVLLPSGLPKNDALPVAATVTKKGRCARLKDGATVNVPTVPWYWDKDVRIAIAPGLTCFEANQTYEHGGVSPQECFVPRLTVTASASTVTSRAEITSIKWRGLSLVVEFADLPDGATVDLRRHAGEATSSFATVARLTGGTGKVILLVEDDDLEGQEAQLVVVDADGSVLLQRETLVGQNR